jgi:hypothetical protein
MWLILTKNTACLLREFVSLTGGVPSHEIFSRVFRVLDAKSFAHVFKHLCGDDDTGKDVIAIDGKICVIPSTLPMALFQPQMVSAWSCEQRLVLAQLATEAKYRTHIIVIGLLN